VPRLPLLGDPVSRTFRRILSGDEEGRPPWVRALERPGDAGWSGPGSAAWEVHGSLATLIGGVRALLLQAAHPLALAGIEQHSAYRTDALGRLQRTNLYVTTTTYGSSAQAAATCLAVRKVHERVRGTAPDGRPYSANDPRLLLWVHVALTESMLRAAQAYGPRDVDADRYVAETAVTAEHMGIEEPPRSEAELAATLEGFRPELAGGEHTREVVRFLARPPLPLGAQPVYRVFRNAATALLPDWAPELLGLRPRPSLLQAADARAAEAVLATLRVLLGPISPGERAARLRLSGAVST
jgi:uncharacterized protein (DUF2236 family)